MRYLCGLLITALLLAPLAILHAGTHSHRGEPCCEVRCPRCEHTCKFSVDTEKEAKDCYSSECKPVCIPKVVFPWQKKACCGASCCDSCSGAGCGNGGERCCAANNGACVRYVNVLKKFEYECEVCKYKWEALRVCCPANCGGSPAAASPMESAPAADDSATQPMPPASDATSRQINGLLRYIGF